MTCLCPNCGQALPVDPARDLEAGVEELREGARLMEIFVTWDGLVNEPGACRLLGYKRDWLRRQIEEQRDQIPYQRRGNRRLYSLTDLARYRLGS
ncbi:hypothetical protein D9M69_503150 [compost metagenome]